MTEAERILTTSFRDDRAVVLATLAARLGDLDVAEDAVQEAFAQAAVAWPRDGVPDAPRAWLHVVARRRAVDLLRRADSQRRRASALAADLEASAGDEDAVDDAAAAADLLGLVLACAHPALSLEARVAVTLRCVVGLTTEEVAAVHLVSTSAMAQRIVRAKRKLRVTGVRLVPPSGAELAARLGAACAVVHAVLTTGHLAGSGEPVRGELVDEASWLARRLHGLVPGDGEVAGLHALALYHRARLPGRTDPAGNLVTLDRQDRTRWDRDLVAEADDVLRAARRDGPPGRYWLETAIAAEHTRAPSLDGTDWRRIAALYRALEVLTRSPVVTVNRAVAVAHVDGPEVALALLECVADDPALADGPLVELARAELCERLGRHDEAEAAHDRALARTSSPAQRRALVRRRRDRAGHGPMGEVTARVRLSCG